MINGKAKVLSYFIFTALVMLIAVTPVLADGAGTFTFVDGRVDILKPGQERAFPVELGAPVSSQDIIRTKRNSRAEITMNDGTVFRLAQSSRVEISSYMLDESGALKEGTINLTRGKMRAITLSDNPALKVKTPNALADNINGTDFFFIYEKGSSWFYGSGGSLQASRKENPAQAVSVDRRKCIRVVDGVLLGDSCTYNDIDVKKYGWDTAAAETVPVVAQLPAEGEVFTYTPLGGPVIDTPSQAVSIGSADLTCPQCPVAERELQVLSPDIPPVQPDVIKMGHFERIDNGCCNPVPPAIVPQ
jgi:hypothetical protein